MNKYLYSLILITVVSLHAPDIRAGEPSERERALEARVEQLERLVEHLMEARDASAAPAAGSGEGVVERVAKLEEEKAPRVTSDPEATFSYGGFIKTDVMMSRYNAGSAPPRGLIRDFYVPALVPVGGESSTTDIDYHMRESRFWFQTATETPAGKPLRGYLEFDFSAATGGDERLTNATSPSIRHAFIQYDNRLLIGQFWSNFFNVGALAENLDFVGPAEGTLFIRQPLIQYTAGSWQIAAENPETTVTPHGGGDRIVTDTGYLPDLTARYTVRGDWGHFAIAGLGRQLAIDGPNGTSRKAAFAASLSGLVKIGERNDFRWMLNGGPGIGRYLGLNTANDAVLDADGNLEPIDAYGGFVSYRHFWTPRLRSNFTLSAFYADNDTELTGLGPTKEAQSAHANLIYQFTPQLRFGVEYIHARRKIEAGDKGNMNRVQFSTIYAF